MSDPSKVLAEALDLPVRERLRIGFALLRGIDPEADEDTAEAWLVELEQRAIAIEHGTARRTDAAAVHARVREALRARRAARR